MSSINDALRRVSRDLDTPGSGELFSQGPAYSRRRSIGLWLGLSLAAAVVGAWFLFFRPSPPPRLVTAVVAPVERTAPAKPAPQTAAIIKKEAPARPPAPTSPSPAEPAASVKPKVLPASSPPDKKPMAKVQVKSAGSKDTALALKVRPSLDPAENPPRRALAYSSKPPATAQDHFQAARSAQDRGLDSKAVHHYRQALLADPRLAEAYLNLGNIFFFRQRSPEKALEMYKQVLRLDPNNKMAHNNLGFIFFRQGLPGKARTEFSAALQKDPKYVDALYNMACLAANAGNPPQAMGYLSRAVRIQPEAAVWAAEDEDLKSLHRRPEFQKLARRAETIQPQGK
ncbi:MAG: tetratricopeptide repeat protein [Thermodesulfobacteriota bacterium]|nr:tetratricopeptide repeat protein [Thermodesulfobacteriota bacterium]